MPQLIHWTGSVVIAAVLAIVLVPVGTPGPEASQDVNPHAAVLADFQKRIDEYRKLHDKVAKGPAEMKETSDPAQIKEAQTALADRLRAARSGAKPGDIFTAEIRAVFRRLMYPEVTGPGSQETKAAIRDDAPAAMPLKVNASYPEGQPRPTVPANVLANLPRLPKDLEYRIVDKHLVLLDVDAALIVDFIPNAIQ
jgi:hypothetical protein